MLRKFILAVIIITLTLETGCFSGIGPEEIVSFVLTDSSENIIIGYKVQRSDEDHEIHLQKVGPNGAVIWDESLPVDKERRASIIGMAGGENGSVYVAWEVLGPEGQRRSARVTRLAYVDANGQINFQKEFTERSIQMVASDVGCVIVNQAGDEIYHALYFGKDGNNLWDQAIPEGIALKLVAGADGEALMMWQDTDFPYFVVQKLDTNGDAIWGDEGMPEGIRIKYLETASRPEHQIISDRLGGAIVSWAEMTGSEMPAYVWVCRIGDDGQTTCEEPVRDLASAINIYTRVVTDGSGGAIVVWEDLREGMALYAQRVNAEGEDQWHGNGVPVCTELPVVSPRFEAADTGAGGVVVAWIDGDRNLCAQMLDASGQKQWGDKGILIADGVCNQPVKLCGDNHGGYIIGWSTGWDTYQPNDSYVQKIDAEGNLLWSKDGIKLDS
jgi:hypothetical protein